MDKEEIKERILQWQLLAEQYKKENQNVFIKKINGDINFCKIISICEIKILVDIYAPEQRAGEKENIDWLSIIKFDKVVEREE